jgi:1-acyl-sn-glycerol-3-phosphate acyltransferase
VLNHQSSLDGMPLGMLKIPRLAIMGKKELAYIPFIGWTFYLAGNVLLNRGDGRKAKGQLDAGVEAIAKRKVSIAVFPEGSRNRDTVGFLPFKRGGFQMAIDAQVSIVPVVIQSFKHVYDKKARQMHRGTVQVAVLPAVATTGYTHKDSAKLAQLVQSQMETRFSAFEPN